jgi:hypothetical protein
LSCNPTGENLSSGEIGQDGKLRTVTFDLNVSVFVVVMLTFGWTRSMEGSMLMESWLLTAIRAELPRRPVGGARDPRLAIRASN